MNKFKTPWLAVAILLLISNGGSLMAIEEAEYSLVQQSGDNQSSDEISMTSPVSQRKPSEKIAMTAPVSQQTPE